MVLAVWGHSQAGFCPQGFSEELQPICGYYQWPKTSAVTRAFSSLFFTYCFSNTCCNSIYSFTSVFHITVYMIKQGGWWQCYVSLCLSRKLTLRQALTFVLLLVCPICLSSPQNVSRTGPQQHKPLHGLKRNPFMQDWLWLKISGESFKLLHVVIWECSVNEILLKKVWWSLNQCL